MPKLKFDSDFTEKCRVYWFKEIEVKVIYFYPISNSSISQINRWINNIEYQDINLWVPNLYLCDKKIWSTIFYKLKVV